MAIIKKKKTASGGECVEKPETFCTVCRHAKWHRCCGKQYGNSQKH
jgi:hypothetical protein